MYLPESLLYLFIDFKLSIPLSLLLWLTHHIGLPPSVDFILKHSILLYFFLLPVAMALRQS